MDACKDRKFYEVRKMLETNKTLLRTKFKNKTLLCYAAQEGNIEFMNILLKAGINVNQAGSTWDRTALHIAVQLGLKKVALFLINNGADISITDACGNSPLFLAIQYGHVDIGKLLINHGANLYSLDKECGGDTLVKINDNIYQILVKHQDEYDKAVQHLTKENSKDQLTTCENKYIFFSVEEIQCLQTLKTKQLEEVDLEVSTIEDQVDQILMEKSSKIVDIDQKEAENFKRAQEEMSNLDDKIKAAKNQLKVLEAEKKSSLARHHTRCYQLSCERNLVESSKDKEINEMKSAQLLKLAMKSLINQEIKLIIDAKQRKSIESAPPKFKHESTQSNRNNNFMEYLETRIETLELELQCPVCLDVAEHPKVICAFQHFLCTNCFAKITSYCPQCRNPLVKHQTNNRFLVMITEQLKELYSTYSKFLSSQHHY